MPCTGLRGLVPVKQIELLSWYPAKVIHMEPEFGYIHLNICDVETFTRLL